MDIIEKKITPASSVIPAAAPELIAKAESRFRKGLDFLGEEILTKNSEVLLLAGPSSSGKTTTAEKLVSFLKSRGKDAFVMSLDNFFKNREDTPLLPDGTQDFESPDNLDIPLFEEVITKIHRGFDLTLPVFDFKKGSRSDEKIKLPHKKGRIFVFEGIHALNPRLIAGIASEWIMRIFICPRDEYVDENEKKCLSGTDIRLARRLTRDFFHRSAGGDVTFEMWENVLKGEKKYIMPYRGTADYYINSSHPYEPMIWVPFVGAICEKMTRRKEQGAALRTRLARFASISPGTVPPDSLLQEFLP